MDLIMNIKKNFMTFQRFFVIISNINHKIKQNKVLG